MIDKYILSHINSIDRIALAVSGGSDSMAMLFWFCENVDHGKFYVVNIEHGIRGDDSIADSLFVSQYCQKIGVTCLSYSVDTPHYASANKVSHEQAARILRHNIFSQECLERANFVALAHHQSDQAESVLMHIARGAGINGLCGMKYQEGHILRPLIDTSKAKIMEYVSLFNIPYVVDSTNIHTEYDRNFLRNIAIPSIKTRYPSFDDNLVKLSRSAWEVADYFDSTLPTLMIINNTVALSLSDIHPFLGKELIRRAINLLGISVDIEERHISKLWTIATTGKPWHVDLPHHLKGYYEKGQLVLTTLVANDFSFDFDEGEFETPDGYLMVSEIDVDDNYDFSKIRLNDGSILLDKDTLPSGLIIRNRRIGDYLIMAYGKKSLGDYMTDIKIPQRLRDMLPVIAQDSCLISLSDIIMSNSHLPCCSTKKIMKIKYYTKGEYYEKH